MHFHSFQSEQGQRIGLRHWTVINKPDSCAIVPYSTARLKKIQLAGKVIRWAVADIGDVSQNGRRSSAENSIALSAILLGRIFFTFVGAITRIGFNPVATKSGREAYALC